MSDTRLEQIARLVRQHDEITGPSMLTHEIKKILDNDEVKDVT